MKKSVNPFKLLCMLAVSFLLITNANAQGWAYGRWGTGGAIDSWPMACDNAGNVFGAGYVPAHASPIVFGSGVTLPPATTGSGTSMWIKYDNSGTPLWAALPDSARASFIIFAPMPLVTSSFLAHLTVQL